MSVQESSGGEADIYGIDDPRSSSWCYNPEIHTDEQLALWADTQWESGNDALESELAARDELHFMLEPQMPVVSASHWLELGQQHLDGFNTELVAEDTRRCSFSRGISAEFWGFTKEQFSEMFEEVTPEDEALLEPQHIRQVLFMTGPCYGRRKGTALDNLAFDSRSFVPTIGKLSYIEDRTAARTRAANEANNPNFDPNDPKVERSVFHMMDQKEAGMVQVLAALREEDEWLGRLKQSAEKWNLGKGLMSGAAMRDRVIDAVNISFGNILRAMALQLEWDSEQITQMRLTLWKRLFDDPNKISNWHGLLREARIYEKQKAVRVDKRLQQIAKRRERGASKKFAS